MSGILDVIAGAGLALAVDVIGSQLDLQAAPTVCYPSAVPSIAVCGGAPCATAADGSTLCNADPPGEVCGGPLGCIPLPPRRPIGGGR